MKGETEKDKPAVIEGTRPGSDGGDKDAKKDEAQKDAAKDAAKDAQTDVGPVPVEPPKDSTPIGPESN